MSIATALETSVAYLVGETPSVAPTNPGGNSEALFQPASRPSGSEEMGRQPTVTISFTGELPVEIAAQVLALIQRGKL